MGIARAVIVGRTKETPELMKAAFEIVEHLIETGHETVPMEMVSLTPMFHPRSDAASSLRSLTSKRRFYDKGILGTAEN